MQQTENDGDNWNTSTSIPRCICMASFNFFGDVKPHFDFKISRTLQDNTQKPSKVAKAVSVTRWGVYNGFL